MIAFFCRGVRSTSPSKLRQRLNATYTWPWENECAASIMTRSNAFVDGYRPSRFKRVLTEYPFHGFADFPGLRVNDILHVRPFPGFDFDGLGKIVECNFDFRLADACYPADLAVKIALKSCGIVFDEHHLGSRLERKFSVCGKKILRKIALYVARKRMRRSVETGHPPLVDRTGRIVMRCQRDIPVFVVGDESGNIS